MDKHGRAPLHLAARGGDLRALTELLALRPDLDAADKHGFTALYHACLFGHEGAISLLLQAGADISKPDLGGLSALHIACEKGHAGAAVALCRNGADLDAVDSIGRTPLDWARAKEHSGTVEAIREWQSATARDCTGTPPGTGTVAEVPAPPTLCTLGEDALLLVLEHCDSATLTALELSCSAFSGGAGANAPPLPERAAEAALRALYESGAARPYDRGAAETHKRVLALHERGLLRPGVLHDIPMSAVEQRDSGWVRAYKRPYCHRTRDADLDDAIPAEARYVMLGAVSMAGALSTSRYDNGVAVDAALPSHEALMSGAAPAFALLAWGRRETVLKTTHGAREFGGGATTSDNAEGGVHWYRWPEHAIGFSSDPDLFLYYADSAVARGRPEKAPGDRLSWNLENLSTGGWRAGLAYNLGSSSEWLKCCYYRL